MESSLACVYKLGHVRSSRCGGNKNAYRVENNFFSGGLPTYRNYSNNLLGGVKSPELSDCSSLLGIVEAR